MHAAMRLGLLHVIIFGEVVKMGAKCKKIFKIGKQLKMDKVQPQATTGQKGKRPTR